MSGCGNCSGDCAHCGGCSGALVLTEGEIRMLQELAQIPFLPVARKMGILPRCIWKTMHTVLRNTV